MSSSKHATLNEVRQIAREEIIKLLKEMEDNASFFRNDRRVYADLDTVIYNTLKKYEHKEVQNAEDKG